MLQSLEIERIGVINQAKLNFGSGFTALTGETGAGKTMVVTGLSLLLGARLDSRRAGNSSTIEGIIQVHPNSKLAEALEELGADVEEGELQVVRRVTKEGRSRSHVGGVPVPISTLANLLGEEITIHGQSDQLRLKDPAAQLEALDSALADEVKEKLIKYRENYDEYQELLKEQAQLEKDLATRGAREQTLTLILEKIADADTYPNEDHDLKAEISALSSAQESKQALDGAIMALVGDESSSALTYIDHALDSLKLIPDSGDETANFTERLILLREELLDLSSLISRTLEISAASPMRLEQAQQRLYQLTQLIREVGTELSAKDITAVLNNSQQALADLESLANASKRLEQINEIRALKLQELESEAEIISNYRSQLAQNLSAQIDQELKDLMMPGAKVKINLKPAALGPTGIDRIEFLLRPHPGSQFLPLAKSASGGELSRIMLALEVSIASLNDKPGKTPVFIFDEIDAGIGGRAAKAVGERLAKLAQKAQVIVVTHLPQVAAYAGVHLLIQKEAYRQEEQLTVSTVSQLSYEQRVIELARMLAGDEDSTTARQHALELLKASQKAGFN